MPIVACRIEKQKGSLNPEDNTCIRSAVFTLILIWGLSLLAWVVENDWGSGFQWANLYTKVYKLLGQLTTCGKNMIFYSLWFTVCSYTYFPLPQIGRE